jgi:hypothetical protein
MHHAEEETLTVNIRNATALTSCLVLASTGCIETIFHPASEPRPTLEERATAVPEVRHETPVAEVDEVADGVEIAITESTSCRISADQPAEQERLVERRLTAAGWIGQGILATTAIGSGVAGGYLVAEPCSLGDAAGVGCLGPASDIGTGVGIGSFVVSGLLTAALFGQGLSALDTTETDPAPLTRVEGNWRTCRVRPVADEPVELWFSDGYVALARTDALGKARFAWSAIPTSHVYVSFPKARLRFGDRELATVSFRGTDLYARAQRANRQYQAWLAGRPSPQETPAAPAASVEAESIVVQPPHGTDPYEEAPPGTQGLPTARGPSAADLHASAPTTSAAPLPFAQLAAATPDPYR